MKRMTRQRRAILDCFKKFARALSVEEILDITAQDIPELNLSTIYRNLKILLDEGTIHLVNIPGLSPRYEIAKTLHHHHFLCQACDQLFDISDCPSGISNLIPEGFKMISHSITLKGFCRNCINSA